MGTADLFSPNVIAVMLLWVYCQPMTPSFLLESWASAPWFRYWVMCMAVTSPRSPWRDAQSSRTPVLVVLQRVKDQSLGILVSSQEEESLEGHMHFTSLVPEAVKTNHMAPPRGKRAQKM